jgi:hypothetical protein
MPRYVLRNGDLVDKATGEPMKVHTAFIPRPYVMGDTKPYASPITGEIIDGRAARREDLKKHGCIEAGDMPRRQYVHKEKYAKLTGLPLKGRDI